MKRRTLPDTDLTVEEFVEAISSSGVLSDSALSELQQHLPNDGQQRAIRLATELVEDGLLTTYQARVILERGDSPLLLDRYVILDSIGAGGMGIVFKALQQSLERVVAVKVLPKHAVDSPDKIQRFQREMRSVAKISHPNVVQAFDAHESNGVYFFVMEYVSGNDLAELVTNQGPLPVRDAIEVLVQIAAGLESAHEHGIIHRDVKPSNVLLRDDGVAKVLDLGLSRTREVTRETTANELTRDGLAMGTVSYMSPEQAFDAKQATERSDIYSLGCTLYFLLHGRPMFDEPNAVQTIVAHREAPAPQLGDGCDGVPQPLETLFQQMVAKAPDDRPASMAEVQASLAECLHADQGTANESLAVSRTREHVGIEEPVHESIAIDRTRSSWKWGVAATVAIVILGVFFTDQLPIGLDKAASDTRTVATDLLKGDSISLVVETVDEIFEVDFAGELPGGSFQIVGAVYYVDRDINLQRLSELPNLKSLTFVGGSGVDARPVAELTGLERFSDLESLDLQGVSISGTAASQISRLQGLNSLSIVDCEIAADATRRILAELKALRDLVLNELSIGDADVGALAGLKQLEYLDLANTRITSRVLEHLVDLPQLTQLTLTGVEIRGGLDVLPKLTAVQALHLDATNLRDSDIPAVTSIPQLRFIDVSHTKLTTDGVRTLARASKLEDLWLMGVPTQLAAADIGALSQLRSLNLHNSDINDEGLESLYQLRNLNELYLGETPTTKAAIDRLKLRLPQCEVHLKHPDEWLTAESAEFILDQGAP